MGNDNFELRAYNPTTDEGFIKSAFLRGYRQHPETWELPNEVFFPTFTRVLDLLLAGAAVVVAHAPGSPDDLAGFCIFGLGRLYYVYVARPYRRLGCGRFLLESADLTDAPIVSPIKPRDHLWKVARDKGLTIKVDPWVIVPLVIEAGGQHV